jgi:N6-L-threonylcarbamoyladenine synthase
LHSIYGGVFPEMASRQHLQTIFDVIDQTLQHAHMSLEDIDALAVTRGPGLAGSLLIGLNFAKGLALSRGIPIIGINHLEGHIYSAWVVPGEEPESYSVPEFPLLALLVSGGHTELNLMTDHCTYQHLGGTQDDAAGEAFDKVARLLGLAYPGGPSIQEAAQRGNPTAFNFPRARMEGTWNFSFSGLKTAVLRVIKQIELEGRRPPVEDLAASFQTAVVDSLVKKTFMAARSFKTRNILVAGGVSANRELREAFTSQKEFKIFIPPLSFCTDNASMIATAGYFRYLRGQRDSLDMDVLPNWLLS